MDLSIIILSYKSKKDLTRLLPSVFASQNVSFTNTPTTPQPLAVPLLLEEGRFSAEVIVVDNGSTDGTYEWLEHYVSQSQNQKITLIKNSNTGFSAGNNLGIKKAVGENILLLNPDTKLESDTLEKVLDFVKEKPNLGIVGCKVLKPDGSLDLACRRRFPNPVNSFSRLFLKNNKDYNYLDKSEDETMQVDSVMGAFLLIKKSVIENVGLLDESFFMYGEDLDWCFRVKDNGFEVWYYPQSSITHFKGSSSVQVPFKALKWFHDAMWIFYKKHYFKKYPFVLHPIIFLGIYLRMLALVFINLFKSKPYVSK